MQPFIRILGLTLLATASVLPIAACSTMSTVKEAPPDAGSTQTFKAAYDDVTAATLEGLRGLNVEIASTEEQREGLVILVSQSPRFGSWGEVGRIIVERSSGPPTNVRVFWRKRATYQLFGTREGEFASALFGKIRTRLVADAQ